MHEKYNIISSVIVHYYSIELWGKMILSWLFIHMLEMRNLSHFCTRSMGLIVMYQTRLISSSSVYGNEYHLHKPYIKFYYTYTIGLDLRWWTILSLIVCLFCFLLFFSCRAGRILKWSPLVRFCRLWCLKFGTVPPKSEWSPSIQNWLNYMGRRVTLYEGP